MIQVVRSLVVVALVACLLAAPALAQEQTKKKKKRGRAGNSPLAAVLKKAKDSDLSEETVAKIQELVKAHQPKLQEARKKLNSVITADIRKARAAARKAAAAEGKKGRELRDAVNAAVKLSDEQQKQVDAAQKEAQAVMQEFRKAVAALVTPEQAKKLGVATGRAQAAKKGGPKAKGKKKKQQQDS